MIKFFRDYEQTVAIAQFLGLHTALNPFERETGIEESLDPFLLIKYTNPTNYTIIDGLTFSNDILTQEMEDIEIGYVFTSGKLLFEDQLAFTQSDKITEREMREKVYLKFCDYRHENIQVSCSFYGTPYNIVSSSFYMANDNNNTPGTFIPLSSGFGITPKNINDTVAFWLKYIAPIGENMGRFFCPALQFKYDLIP